MVDPLVKFDPETVVKIFSLLSSPDIAISASTSRGWRNQILTDPIINKVIDLSGLSLNEDKTIELVNHLVSLSTHEDRKVGKELHLNLNPFWKTLFLDDPFDEPFDQDRWRMSSSYAALLKAIFSSTKGQLSKMYFRTNEGEVDEEVNYSHVGELMVQTIKILDDPLLREIHWSIPFPFTATSKGQKGSKVFSIHYTEDLYYNHDFTSSFLQSMNAFTKGGLTKLIITLSDLVGPDEGGNGLKGVDDEIRKSKSTIEELEMSFSYRAAPQMFDLVEGMESLSSLCLRVKNKEQVLQLVSPRGCPSFHLKELVLELCCCSAEMGWIVNWAGKTLEILQLSFSPLPSLSELPASILSAIIENNSSLKQLHLVKVSISNDSSSTSTSNLSNLESLYIDSLNSFGYQFLSNCSMPRISSLGIEGLGFVGEEDISRVTNHLCNIVKGCCLSLVRLNLTNKLKGPIPEDPQALPIGLPKLEEVRISRSDVTAFQFLRNFRFQLKRLDISHGSAPMQSIFKQLLEPSSQELEEISLGFIQEDIDGNEVFDPESKKLSLSLSNLKSLRILSDSTAILNGLSQAASGSLKYLYFNFPSSKSPFPNSIVPLLASNALSLTTLYLRNNNERVSIESGFNGTGSEFSNLVELSLSNIYFMPLQMLFRSSFPNLSSLKLFYFSFSRPLARLSAFQVLEFIRKTSATLKDLSVEISHFQEDEDEILERVTEQVLLPNLRHLSCFNNTCIGLLRHMVGLKDPRFRSWSKGKQRKKIAKKFSEIAPRLVTMEIY